MYVDIASHTHTQARNATLDLMKGIAILFMIYAHVSDIELVNRIVFSFHMPLFFLLAGYLSKDNCEAKEILPFIAKSGKRLLIPYVVTMLLICLWIWRFEIIKLRFNFTLQPLLNLLWGSGDMYISEYGRLYVGPLWFLMAIFVTRVVFYMIRCVADKCASRDVWRMILILLLSAILSIAAIVLYPYVEPLPWNVLPGIAALIFYAIGWGMKMWKIQNIPIWMRVMFVVAFGVVLMWNLRIDLRSCEYGIIPLNILGACGGTLLVYYICKGIEWLANKCRAISSVRDFLIWCGVGSLAILCMHSLDLMGGVSTYFAGFLGSKDSVQMLMHFTIPLMMTWGMSKVKFVRRIFY
jgi:fucose 4-O-acetylase-like acetyltransferase